MFVPLNECLYIDVQGDAVSVVKTDRMANDRMENSFVITQEVDEKCSVLLLLLFNEAFGWKKYRD